MTDYVLSILGPFDVPGLLPRRARVYVPPRAPKDRPSPVLFMFDGQNLFHDEPSFAGGWHLHSTVRRLAVGGKRAPVIVGIDHGGEARIQELTPWPTEHGGGRLDVLLDWLTGWLMPRVREEFHVAADPSAVGIGGSSLGGLAALYAHLRSPAHFGLALSMSPSLWVGGGRMHVYAASQPKPETSRIYMDAGTLEGGGSVVAAGARLTSELKARGYGSDALKWVVARRGKHSEEHWRRRAGKAIEFLFSGAPRSRPLNSTRQERR